MSLRVSVQVDRLLAEIERLERMKPPRNPLYLQRLKTMVSELEELRLSELVRLLASAGYTLDDIVDFVIRAGVLPTPEERAELRRAVMHAILAGGGPSGAGSKR